jgi:tetratricopeptide (TPR) repeat protein
MRATILRTLTLALLPLPLLAQTAWVGPQPPCDLKPGHFRVNSAVVNLKTAAEKPVQRDRMLAQTVEVLTRTIAQDGQDKNPAAWYYLGRYYAEVHDARGADTAFDRAEALAPQCAHDITGYRDGLWSDTYAAAQRNQQEGRVDSAAALYHAALGLRPADPRPLYGLGSMYAVRDQIDSATAYLSRAADLSAGDTAYNEARRDALAQVARLAVRRAQGTPAVATWGRTRFSRDSIDRAILGDSLVLARIEASSSARRARGGRLSPADQQAFTRDSTARAQALAAGRAARQGITPRAAADSAAAQPALEPAIAAARGLVAAFPDDAEGVGALALVFAQSGRVATAAAAFDSIYAAPGLDAEAVIEAGRRIVRAGLPGPGATVLARGLSRAAWHRDGWGDLATAARGLRDGPRMLDAGRHLFALDPLSRTAVRHLATAFELLGQADSSRRYQAVADTGLGVEVDVSSFVPGDGGYTLTAIATNVRNTPSAPLRLAFEFVRADGSPAGSQTVVIPAISPHSSYQFDVRVAGTDVRGWRYRLN